MATILVVDDEMGIRELLSETQLAAKFGAAGRERVLQERTWAANAVALARELEMLGVTNR